MTGQEFALWFDHKPSWVIEAYGQDGWYVFAAGFTKPRDARDRMRSEEMRASAAHVGVRRLRVVRVTKDTSDTLDLDLTQPVTKA